MAGVTFRKRETDVTPDRREDMSESGIYARYASFLDRHVQLGVAQGRVLSVAFPDAPDAAADADHELLDRIEAYLDGEPDEFADVRVALTLPTEKREVLEATRGLPYGRDATVDQLARMVPGDDPEADHARVREALAANPAPVFVPSHRVRDGPGGAPPDVVEKLRALEGL